MSVELKNISKSFGTQEVLKSNSFSVKAGEIVGFLGPNGAGKSTTMKILAGLTKYDSGSAKICDLEVSDYPIETKSCIGYLPEQNPLYNEMYIREFLDFIADLHKLGKGKKERIEELIETLGLIPEAHKKIGQLSKGYKQRVGLAQALIHNPKVLILDEPTSGLDPNQLVEIRELIRKTGEERSVIFSTHIMQEIEAVCNRVIVINEGEIVADFPDIESLKQLNRKQVRIEVEFMNPTEIPPMESLISADTTDRLHYTLLCEKDLRSEIFDYAVKTENKVLSLKVSEKGMEELFRELTQG